MDFSVWLKNYRKGRKLSRAELAVWLNTQAVVEKTVDQNIISNWENNRSAPDYKTMLALCYCAGLADPYITFLGVTHGYKLNEEGQRKLDDYARLLEESSRYAYVWTKPTAREIRFYDVAVSAGTGQFLDSDNYEMRPVDDCVPSEADYAVRIAGDSMEPCYQDNQWIAVAEQQTLNRGDIGIFYYDGNSYCKVLGEEKGHPALLSLNPIYPPILVGEEGARVLGRVVGTINA
jgi:SOS-response transcriptional repressor LexA